MMKRRAFVQSSLLAAAITVPGITRLHAAVRTGKTPDVAALTGDGRDITLRGKDIEDFAARLRGKDMRTSPRDCAARCCSLEKAAMTKRA